MILLILTNYEFTPGFQILFLDYKINHQIGISSMIKNTSFLPNQLDKKLKACRRFLLLLNKLQQQFTFRKLSQSFGRLIISRSKGILKIVIIDSIKRRNIQQAFLTLKSHSKSVPNKDKCNAYVRKLLFTTLIRFFHLKQRKNYQFAFQKIIAPPISYNSLQITAFISIITSFANRFQKRVFSSDAFFKMKKSCSNQIRIQTFFNRLNSYCKKIKHQQFLQSFDSILKESFRKTYLNDVKRKQEKTIEVKNHNLSKQQQNRLLRSEISALTKTLQFQQASKNKSRKDDYDRNLILQAKNTQRERTNQEFRKITFENDSLNHELNKKQGYLKLKQDSIKGSENTESMFRKTYHLFRNQKTKQSMSMRQFSILLNRENIDLNQILKKFGLSKESFLNQNIDLKNIQNLYEKDMPGYGFNVNIKESETYRKTMEQNMNLREFLQVLLVKILSAQQKQMMANKEQLNRLIQNYQGSQKGSKLTLTTLSSSTNGFSR